LTISGRPKHLKVQEMKGMINKENMWEEPQNSKHNIINQINVAIIMGGFKNYHLFCEIYILQNITKKTC
jgi:hypothetical protein